LQRDRQCSLLIRVQIGHVQGRHDVREAADWRLAVVVPRLRDGAKVFWAPALGFGPRFLAATDQAVFSRPAKKSCID
jgi:hypothetical protein